MATIPARVGPEMRYTGAIAAVCLATLGTFLIYSWIEPSISLLFFPAVVIPAMYGGYGPSLLATVLSTISLAYFFVPPRNSFSIGIDDLIRLVVFVVVAVATASISSARKRAEDALRKSLTDLQGAHDTLRKVSGWPVLIDADAAAGMRRMLQHAAGVIGATDAVAVWEAEEEPWLYVAASASTGDIVTKHPPMRMTPLVADSLADATFVGGSLSVAGDALLVSQHGSVMEWHGEPVNAGLLPYLRGNGVASAPFRTEHLSGRVFFTGLSTIGRDVTPTVEVVAREVGNSLDQLYLAERMQRLAAREERIRLARDLHDGVLQSLTGIRLELQGMADDQEREASTKDRLLAIERAIAIEQRELRLFIDEVKPVGTSVDEAGPVAQSLEEMRARLGLEWKAPIVIRVTPPTMSVPHATDRAIRLMVHEAIINALKHGHPSRVSVDVEWHEADGLRIVVCDDGRGFSFRGKLDHEAIVRTNTGPASLRDRVVALGGRMSIESTAAGSRVEIALPAAS